MLTQGHPRSLQALPVPVPVTLYRYPVPFEYGHYRRRRNHRVVRCVRAGGARPSVSPVRSILAARRSHPDRTYGWLRHRGGAGFHPGAKAGGARVMSRARARVAGHLQHAASHGVRASADDCIPCRPRRCWESPRPGAASPDTICSRLPRGCASPWNRSCRGTRDRATKGRRAFSGGDSAAPASISSPNHCSGAFMPATSRSSRSRRCFRASPTRNAGVAASFARSARTARRRQTVFFARSLEGWADLVHALDPPPAGGVAATTRRSNCSSVRRQLAVRAGGATWTARAVLLACPASVAGRCCGRSTSGRRSSVVRSRTCRRSASRWRGRALRSAIRSRAAASSSRGGTMRCA